MGDIVSESTGDFISVRLGDFVGIRTYYAYSINKYLTFTADYQFVNNPAYNADRGPVSIFSGRLHGDF